MDVNSMRNYYKSIWFTNMPEFNVKDITSIVRNEKILTILSKKFGFEFTQIDSDLYMYIINDNYHIVKENDDESFSYMMFTRIERHDDSCTYVKNSLHPRFSL